MLAIDLMMEMARRAQPDRDFWRPDTAALARWAGREAAYCLDAALHELAYGTHTMAQQFNRETP